MDAIDAIKNIHDIGELNVFISIVSVVALIVLVITGIQKFMDVQHIFLTKNFLSSYLFENCLNAQM